MTRMVFHGGPVISNAEVVIVYYGSSFGKSGIGDWMTDPVLREQACRLTAFFSDITESAYMDSLSEYTPYGVSHIGRGKLSGTAFIPFPPGKKYGQFFDQAIDDREISTMLKIAIQQGQLPSYNPNRLYFVFLPPYVSVKRGQDFHTYAREAGYHSSFSLNGTSTVPYAVVLNPGNDAAILDRPFDQLTFVASHELVEAITDPTTAYDWGWYDSITGEEIADVCAHNLPRWEQFHGYWVCTFWSEKNHKCVAPPEDHQAKPPRAAHIEWKTEADDCNHYPVEGTLVVFQVKLSNLAPQSSILAYQWSVSGGVAKGPDNGPTFSVQMPTSQGMVAVTVEVSTSDGCKLSSAETFTPLAIAQAAFLEHLCRLREVARSDMFTDPLLDPLRDLVRTTISRDDLVRLQQVTATMTDMVNRVLELHEAIKLKG